MVAASINQKDTSNGNLTIRETTLLPNIRGIGPLIALLFCPTMELKCDETKTRYISFISGLGYNAKDKRPIFEEHDSIFHLDVELTSDDFGMVSCVLSVSHIHDSRIRIQSSFRIKSIHSFLLLLQINQLRYCFDTLLFRMNGQLKNERISAENKVKIMIKIKELILT